MTRSTTALNSASSWRRILRKTAVAAIWLMVWYTLYIIVKQEILIVSPVRVLTRLFELMGEGGFWLSMGTSLLRIVAGFLAAVTAGTVIAILSALSSFVRDLFLPVIRIVRAMPVASFIILALIWLNTGGVPVFTAFLMVFPVVWGNIYEGIRNTDHKLLEMAKVFRFPRRKVFSRIYVPSVMPYFIAACNNGIGLAWKAGIAAEVLGVPKNSIGTALYSAKIYLETADVFAWTAVVILLSFMLEKGFTLLLKRAGQKYNVRD